MKREEHESWSIAFWFIAAIAAVVAVYRFVEGPVRAGWLAVFACGLAAGVAVLARRWAREEER